jgi:hypothetical protein
MRIDAILDSPEGRHLSAQLAQSLGIDESQARTAAASLLPALIKGLNYNTLSRAGMADLLAALATGHHDRVIADPSRLARPETIEDGNRILGHVLGSREASRAVAARAMRATGISAEILKRMLPMLAVFVLGWVFRSGKGAMGDVLARVPQGGRGAGLELPRPTGSSTIGNSPLPMPDLGRIGRNGSADNPYGELSDILRRGGGGSGGLGNVIRDVLGSVLGFRQTGIIGWILRFIVYRFGWRILTYILRRLFLRA